MTMTSLIRSFALSTLACGILLAVAGGCEKVEGASTSSAPQPVSQVGSGPSAVQDGQKFYNQACAACHGFSGQGMPRQGPTLRQSQFVAKHSDSDLVEFIKVGRLASDPKSLMKLQMPAKGTNPSLTDRQLQQIVAYMRQVQKEATAGQTASLGL